MDQSNRNVTEVVAGSAEGCLWYRTVLPMMVLAIRDDHRPAVTIPSGELIAVIGPDEDERCLVIHIRGEQFVAFERDVKAKARVYPNE